jgi:hypothetical protein
MTIVVWLTGLQDESNFELIFVRAGLTWAHLLTAEPAVTAESTVTAEPAVAAELCSSYLKKLTLKRRLNSFQAIHLQRQFDSTFLEYSPH